MIMHDWSEEEDRAILHKWLVNDDKTGPASAALMSLNMLVETVGGRNYTAAEIRGWLEDSGYIDIRVVRFEATGANGAVVGYKPK